MTCPLKCTIYGTADCIEDCAFMTTDGCLLVQVMKKYIDEDYDPIAQIVNTPIFKPPRKDKNW